MCQDEKPHSAFYWTACGVWRVCMGLGWSSQFACTHRCAVRNKKSMSKKERNVYQRNEKGKCLRETHKSRTIRTYEDTRLTRHGTAHLFMNDLFLFSVWCCCSIQSHACRFVFHYFVLFAFFVCVFCWFCVGMCVSSLDRGFLCVPFSVPFTSFPPLPLIPIDGCVDE